MLFACCFQASGANSSSPSLLHHQRADRCLAHRARLLAGSWRFVPGHCWRSPRICERTSAPCISGRPELPAEADRCPSCLQMCNTELLWLIELACFLLGLLTIQRTPLPTNTKNSECKQKRLKVSPEILESRSVSKSGNIFMQIPPEVGPFLRVGAETWKKT